jgi:hypothetical protein
LDIVLLSRYVAEIALAPHNSSLYSRPGWFAALEGWPVYIPVKLNNTIMILFIINTNFTILSAKSLSVSFSLFSIGPQIIAGAWTAAQEGSQE